MSAKRNKKTQQHAHDGSGKSSSAITSFQDDGAALSTVLTALKSSIRHSIDAMDSQLMQLRTQIPHPGLLIHIDVECYGTFSRPLYGQAIT